MLSKFSEVDLLRLLFSIYNLENQGAVNIMNEARRRLFDAKDSVDFASIKESRCSNKTGLSTDVLCGIIGEPMPDEINVLVKQNLQGFGSFLDDVILIKKENNKCSKTVRKFIEWMEGVDSRLVQDENIATKIELLKSTERMGAAEDIEYIKSRQNTSIDGVANVKTEARGYNRDVKKKEAPSSLSKMSDYDFMDICKDFSLFSESDKKRVLETGLKHHCRTLMAILPYETLMYALKYKIYFSVSFNCLIQNVLDKKIVTKENFDAFLLTIRDWYDGLENANDFGWSMLEHWIKMQHHEIGPEYYHDYTDGLIKSVLTLLNDNSGLPLEDILLSNTNIRAFNTMYLPEIEYIDKNLKITGVDSYKAFSYEFKAPFSTVLYEIFDYYYKAVLHKKMDVVIGRFYHVSIHELMEHGLVQVVEILDNLVSRPIVDYKRIVDVKDLNLATLRLVFSLKQEKGVFQKNDYITILLMSDEVRFDGEFGPSEIADFYTSGLQYFEFNDDAIFFRLCNGFCRNERHLFHNYKFIKCLTEKALAERDEFSDVLCLFGNQINETIEYYGNCQYR